MTDFFFRTEDIQPNEVMNLYVDSTHDREIVDSLKASYPVILVGSRGAGKSFLLRVAEQELKDEIMEKKYLPVYLSFTRSGVITGDDPDRFRKWMMLKLCSCFLRSFRKHSTVANDGALKVLSKGDSDSPGYSRVESLVQVFEEAWKTGESTSVNEAEIPDIDEVKEAIADLCEEAGFKKVLFLIDEAAHVFHPDQQRQFFSLYRDLRSPFISCKAAVYPGVSFYGDSFQPSHDATFIHMNRSIHEDNYVNIMKEIVLAQAESRLSMDIERHGKNFAALAYASGGNPRILFRTVASAEKLNVSNVEKVIKEFFRTEIWSEHTQLGKKYPGHRDLIDWGRHFVEDYVLKELKEKNESSLYDNKKTTCFFWVHRDAPDAVKEALRLLEYTGIVTEHSQGIKATRSEIGTRYQAHFGCLMALESSPVATGFDVAIRLSPRRFPEYGANFSAFDSLKNVVPDFSELDGEGLLAEQLAKPIEVLDLSVWQKEKLRELNLNTIQEVLRAGEEKLKEAYYVGEKRARRMRNAALAASFEYLSG